MPRQVDVDEILARNPHIKREQLDEANNMQERLKEGGFERKRYDLAPPFGGHRVSVQESGGEKLPSARQGTTAKRDDCW